MTGVLVTERVYLSPVTPRGVGVLVFPHTYTVNAMGSRVNMRESMGWAGRQPDIAGKQMVGCGGGGVGMFLANSAAGS